MDNIMKNKTMNKRIKNLILNFGIPLLIAAIFILLFNTFFGISRITGESMMPTYKNGQYKLMLKTQDVTKNNIVVFRLPDKNVSYIKRVIATEGDTLELKGNDVYINGKKLNEGYTAKHENEYCYNKITIPKSYIYVMGDNRDYSTDSREFGIVKVSYIKGKIVF